LLLLLLSLPPGAVEVELAGGSVAELALAGPLDAEAEAESEADAAADADDAVVEPELTLALAEGRATSPQMPVSAATSAVTNACRCKLWFGPSMRTTGNLQTACH
jgi:hypothetical protein